MASITVLHKTGRLCRYHTVQSCVGSAGKEQCLTQDHPYLNSKFMCSANMYLLAFASKTGRRLQLL